MENIFPAKQFDISLRAALGAFAAARAAVAAAYLAREALSGVFGPGLPPFILFYPTIMNVALLAGMGRGIWRPYWPPRQRSSLFPGPGQHGRGTALAGFSLILFFAMGVGMSIVAEMYRRARRKAAEYDRRLLQVENETRLSTVFHSSLLGMSIIGLNDQRCRDVNAAFLGHVRVHARRDARPNDPASWDLWADPRDHQTAHGGRCRRGKACVISRRSAARSPGQHGPHSYPPR